VYKRQPAAWAFDDGIEASEYLVNAHGMTAGHAPRFDLDEEKAVQDAVLALIRAGLVQSAHDVSDGGLAVNLAESAIFSGLGATVNLEAGKNLRLDGVLYGEAQSRVVLTARPDAVDAVLAALADRDVQATRLGTVGGDTLTISVDGTVVIEAAYNALAQPYNETIPSIMG